jgi:hypothetical protein
MASAERLVTKTLSAHMRKQKPLSRISDRQQQIRLSLSLDNQPLPGPPHINGAKHAYLL